MRAIIIVLLIIPGIIMFSCVDSKNTNKPIISNNNQSEKDVKNPNNADISIEDFKRNFERWEKESKIIREYIIKSIPFSLNGNIPEELLIFGKPKEVSVGPKMFSPQVSTYYIGRTIDYKYENFSISVLIKESDEKNSKLRTLEILKLDPNIVCSKNIGIRKNDVVNTIGFPPSIESESYFEYRDMNENIGIRFNLKEFIISSIKVICKLGD